MTDSTRDAALRKAYGKATAALRDAHRDEFNSLYAAAARAEGVEWTPRKTDEEKAADQLAIILAEYPHLAPKNDTVVEQAGTPSGGPVTT